MKIIVSSILTFDLITRSKVRALLFPFGNKARSFISYLVSGRYRNFRLLTDWSKRVGDCGACVSSPEQRNAQKDACIRQLKNKSH